MKMMNSTDKVQSKPNSIISRLRSAAAAMFCWDAGTLLLFLAFLMSFLYFDVLWCLGSTFTPFSHPPLYVGAIGFSLLFTLPYVLWRRSWPCWTLLVSLQIFFVANLMYSRTYMEAIPLSSYLIAGNLSEFMPSVAASLHWVDLGFAGLLAGAVVIYRYKCRNRRPAAAECPENRGGEAICHKMTSKAGFLADLAIPVIITIAAFPTPGSFKAHYAAYSSAAYSYRNGPVSYTLFGKLLYDSMKSLEHISAAQRAETMAFVKSRPRVPELPEGAVPRRNLVVIMCESLESWPIGLTYEGHEITPHLNRLIADSTTLYAPHVVSQAKGGRSMDGQLILFAGMLPLAQGAYSTTYPRSVYPSLQQAMRLDRGARSFLFTGDKVKVWNQEAVASNLQIDTVISYPDYSPEESYRGHRKHVGDRSFMQQTIEKLRGGTTWNPGSTALIQMVTYSGHTPFSLPEFERDFTLSGTAPEMLENYLYVTHYVDEALGMMIEYLRSRPDWDDTLLVITGDHEGLAEYRASLASSAKGRGVVNPEPMVPLIIANSPVGGRFDGIAGQSDIYPTLIQILGLQDYKWPGFGRSLLDARRPATIVDPYGKVYGSAATPADSAALAAQRAAWIHSDRILKFNLFRSWVPTSRKSY